MILVEEVVDHSAHCQERREEGNSRIFSHVGEEVGNAQLFPDFRFFFMHGIFPHVGGVVESKRIVGLLEKRVKFFSITFQGKY